MANIFMANTFMANIFMVNILKRFKFIPMYVHLLFWYIDLIGLFRTEDQIVLFHKAHDIIIVKLHCSEPRKCKFFGFIFHDLCHSCGI